MNIAQHWKSRKLTDLAEYINGYAFKPEDWGKDGLPIIRIEQLKTPDSISDYYSGRLPEHNIIDNGDLIFSWSASLFLSIWKAGKAALNQHLFKIIEKEGVDRQFLKQFIEFHLPEITKVSHGSTMQHITRKELDQFRAMFPCNIPEQTKIAEILSTVDQAIERTEALIAKQQRLKTGLMQDLLTRGIDKDGNLRSEDTHEFKDSPLGRIPIEWETKLLDDMLILKQYGISTSLTEEPNGVPVLRMNNLVRGEVSYSDLKYSDDSVTMKVLLNDGDVLFNRTNSIDYVGRTAIYRYNEIPISFASYLVRLVPKPTILLPEYLNSWLNDVVNQTRVKQLATIGVQQANINPTNLGTLEVAIPGSINEQQLIVDAILTCNGAISGTQRNLAKLRSLKTALMQDLLTGKVSVTPLLTEAKVGA